MVGQGVYFIHCHIEAAVRKKPAAEFVPAGTTRMQGTASSDNMVPSNPILL